MLQHCVANTPRADKSWCYRTCGSPRVCKCPVTQVWALHFHMWRSSPGNWVIYAVACFPISFFMTKKIWLQPNWFATSDLSCSLTIFFFWKKNQKYVIWLCKWPKYLTSDANCTKSLSLIAPLIIYRYPIQASVSQHFSKDGLWINSLSPHQQRRSMFCWANTFAHLIFTISEKHFQSAPRGGSTERPPRPGFSWFHSVKLLV